MLGAGVLAANRLAQKGSGFQIKLISVSETFLEKIRNHQMIVGSKEKTFLIRELLHPSVEFEKGFVKKSFRLIRKLL